MPASSGPSGPPRPPVPPRDTYTHGHHHSVVGQHARRTADDCAAFARGVVAADAAILDVGCGPASITVGLARWAPAGHVTGVETGDAILETAARTVADAGVDNVTLREASAYELPFDDDAFDVVYAHQVLQHLSQPVAALVEMARVTRPGGHVAVRDADYATMRATPDTGVHDRWRDVYGRVCRRNDAEPDAGCHLFGWCRAAGLGDVVMSSSVWQFWTPESRREWGYSWADRCLESEFARQAVDYGFATRAEMEEIAAGWRAWADHPDGYFHFIHVEALAEVA
ncbi:MAG TPA: hypothetical protein DEP66_05925 [Acidimicrobiaceae bacterium]|nr:hypothetical protein [Acidimicrobiaceae bacterium]HCB37729.1 hypothetical protein [Acidimicrobiaceae bacterium]